ncbi:MAG: excisionase family DNA-binding protein [Acidimicrobiia bacterium]|nr:excisionase family DNA-binding protein [Acidimicrobiia bacterium]
MPPKTLTLHEAAESLGVHYMTVYRYVRLGMLPATKTKGAWAVSAADLERFSATPKPKRGRAPWKDRFRSRLLAGDEAGAWGVIEAALASGLAPRDVYLKVISGAMRDIGEAWHRDEIGIAAEHRATAITQRLVGRLSQTMARRGPCRGSVVLAGPEGERHDLPLAIISDLLRSEGYDVTNLGCDLPPESIAEVVDENPGAVLGLSVSGPQGRKKLRVAVTTVRKGRPEVRIMVGGIAADAQLAKSVAADVYVEDVDAALEYLASA